MNSGHPNRPTSASPQDRRREKALRTSSPSQGRVAYGKKHRLEEVKGLRGKSLEKKRSRRESATPTAPIVWGKERAEVKKDSQGSEREGWPSKDVR